MSSFTSAESQIEALYVGYFGRAGDPGGVNYWIGQFESGMSLAAIAASFSVQAESTARYPFLANPLVDDAAHDNAAAFINSVFTDLFNHGETAASDPTGFAYWLGRVVGAAGNPQAIGQIIQDIISGAPAGSADDMTLQNKVTVGDAFTTDFAANNTAYTTVADALAHTVVGATTSTSTTVTTEITAITTYLSSISTQPPQTVQGLTTGQDTVTGTNLAISGVLDTPGTGVNTTLQVFDIINPAGTNNSLTVSMINGGNLLNAGNTPVLTNVQALYVTNLTAPAQVNLPSIGPALTTIGETGGLAGSNTTFIGFSGAQITTFAMTNMIAGGVQLVQFAPNAGLTAGGKATGAVTVIINGVPNIPGGANAELVLNNTSPTDGYSTVTLNSIGTVANDLLAVIQGNLDLATLNITGNAALKVDSQIFFATATENVQAGTDTGGFNINIASGAAGKVTVVGGSGTDTVLISDPELTFAGTSLNGGTGTANTLADAGWAGNAADYAALNATTGFQIMKLVDGGGDAVNAALITNGINHFQDANAGDAIVNLASGATVDVLAGGADANTGATGATILNLNIGVASSAGLVVVDQATGFSQINLTSNGTAPNTVTFGNSDNTDFVVTGSDGLTATINGGLSGSTFNASGFTGALTLNGTGFGADVILTGSGTATINEAVGALPDVITYLSGHTKADTRVSNVAASSPTSFDHVTNFALGLDVLKGAGGALHQGVTADLAGTTTGTGMVVSSTYASAAVFIAAAELANAARTAGDAVAWSDGSNTYVAEFTGTAVNNAHIVELLGVTTATAIAATGAGHILIA